MKVFITLRNSALRVDIRSTGKKNTKILTKTVRDLRRQMLSGKIVSYVEEQSGITSATLIFSIQDANVSDVKREPGELLN